MDWIILFLGRHEPYPGDQQPNPGDEEHEGRRDDHLLQYVFLKQSQSEVRLVKFKFKKWAQEDFDVF
jgi:hypothetical protein